MRSLPESATAFHVSEIYESDAVEHSPGEKPSTAHAEERRRGALLRRQKQAGGSSAHSSLSLTVIQHLYVTLRVPEGVTVALVPVVVRL